MIMAYFMLKSYMSVMTAASLFDSTECVSQHNILINSPLTKQKKCLIEKVAQSFQIPVGF